MSPERDYYAILQVNRNASQEAIERSYERLARLYDPGASRKQKAAERYARIQEAYEVLSDRKRRAAYDRRLAGGAATLAGEGAVSQFLSRNFAWVGAGSLIASILIVVLMVVLIGGGGGSSALLNASPTGSATPAGPTAPANPPEVAGEPVTTASGLQYIDIAPSSGISPTQGQTVVVNYTGWLQADGSKFDSSMDRGKPAEFVLGQVIEGWNEGLSTMAAGGTRRLIIPPALGYGEAGSPPRIPANATLIFDIELLAIKDTATGEVIAGQTPAPASATAAPQTPVPAASPTP